MERNQKSMRSILRKRGKLVVTELYSAVRHYIWLVEVLVYILLAYFEEHRLINEHEEEYQRCLGKVSFMLPMPSPARITELFSQ